MTSGDGMRISINLTNYSWPGGPGGLAAALARLAGAAEEAGVDTVWVPDHLLQADPTAAPGDTEMLEAYTTLGFLAAETERVRLGTMVTGVTFRPPALLVKAVTTLDVLSDGDACNLFDIPDGGRTVKHKLEVLPGTAPTSVAPTRRSRRP
jgi:Luciferase-like monooxygenase